MTETHCFNIKVAKLYGVNCAIVLQNLWYWVQKNEKEGTNFHDGYYWIYNSKNDLVKMHPYMTSRQIEYILKKLIKAELIISGNYNAKAYDKTLWYTITKNGRSILQNCGMDETNLWNGSHKIVEPIPNKKRNKKTNNNIYSPAEPCSSEIKDIIDYLNDKLGTAYKASTKSTRSHILARLKEGYSLADFYKVIDTKYEEWGHDAKMSKYLCPDTLFGNKFEKYLNTASSKKKGSEYQSTSRVDISDLFD